jgi:hypothetical protein
MTLRCTCTNEEDAREVDRNIHAKYMDKYESRSTEHEAY